MRFVDFANSSTKKQEEFFRDWIDNTDFTQGMLLRGHSDERHCELDETELLNRVIKDGVSSSTFDSKIDEELNAKEALYFHTTKIINWLNKGINEFETRDEFRTLVLHNQILGVNPDEDVICRGISADLKEKYTSMATMVIERNLDTFSQEGRFFCYIKTFYPDIEHKMAYETGRDFKKEAEKMIENNIYVEGQPFKLPLLKKAFWGFKLAGYDVFEKYDYKKGPCIAIPFEINGTKFRVEFDNESFRCLSPFLTVKTKMPDEKTKYIKLNKNSGIDRDTVTAARQYGNYLKSIFDAIGRGIPVKDAINNTQEPVIAYNIKTCFSKSKETNIQTHDTDNISW